MCHSTWQTTTSCRRMSIVDDGGKYHMGNHLVKTSLVNFPLLEGQWAQEWQEAPEYNNKERQISFRIELLKGRFTTGQKTLTRNSRNLDR